MTSGRPASSSSTSRRCSSAASWSRSWPWRWQHRSDSVPPSTCPSTPTRRSARSSSRSSRCWPASPRWSSASSPSAGSRPNLVQNIFSGAEGQNLLAAGLGVGLLTIPLVASISEDAMRAVPISLREASAGLGARKMSTTISGWCCRPPSPAWSPPSSSAPPGPSGRPWSCSWPPVPPATQALFTVNPLERGSTMTAAMASQASGTDGTISELGFNSLFFVGFVLFVITLDTEPDRRPVRPPSKRQAY